MATFDLVELRNDGVDSQQWPQLKCTAANELEINSTVKGTAFQGDGSELTGKVSTAGDTMTGPLTIDAALNVNGAIASSSLTVDGNVGIGTTSPSAPLQVKATNQTRPDQNGLYIYNPNNSANQNAILSLRVAGTNGGDPFVSWDIAREGGWSMGIDNSDGNKLKIARRWESLTTNTSMTLAPNGNVGIGTTNPTKGKVQIEGSVIYRHPDGYRYFKKANSDLRTTSGYDAPYSLYADRFIGAAEFNAVSDMRIKEVKGVSDSKSDLKVLLQVNITDYIYKDKVANDNKPHKKVLGQEIAEVFPQAVRTHTDVVPDIFQPASIANGWVSLRAHGLQVGERVQLLLEGSEPKIYTIEAVNPDSFQVSLDYEGEVFVYGREVDDFHVVDYDALSMLHISATQELCKVIDALKIEVQQLKAQLNGSHHPIAVFSNP